MPVSDGLEHVTPPLLSRPPVTQAQSAPERAEEEDNDEKESYMGWLWSSGNTDTSSVVPTCESDSGVLRSNAPEFMLQARNPLSVEGSTPLSLKSASLGTSGWEGRGETDQYSLGMQIQTVPHLESGTSTDSVPAPRDQ